MFCLSWDFMASTVRVLKKSTSDPQEAKITELLFLPKKAKKKKKEKHAAEVFHGGSRASLRQQEKREKMLQIQKEQERAEAQAGT